jgi:hypothetical protein
MGLLTCAVRYSGECSLTSFSRVSLRKGTNLTYLFALQVLAYFAGKQGPRTSRCHVPRLPYLCSRLHLVRFPFLSFLFFFSFAMPADVFLPPLTPLTGPPSPTAGLISLALASSLVSVRRPCFFSSPFPPFSPFSLVFSLRSPPNSHS